MADYVIIGNGIASLGCIDGIRSVDKDGKITVISREKHPTYARPLISYYLEGKTTPEKMKYRSDDFYEKNSVTVVYGENAEKIDGGRVVCENSSFDFSSLLIATGSSPFVPPFEGLDSVEKKFSFMTLDDALELEAAVDKNSRVLIIGAGLIGLKCAEGLAGRSAHITVCDLADRVLSSILDEPCAKIVADRLTDAGIELRLGTSAAGFDKNTAHMTDGTDVEFDVLVLAVGVRANIALAKDAGLACGRGITVDEKMRTSAEGIYAAGDVCEMSNLYSDDKKVMAILPNAYIGGYTAGVNMAGGEARFENPVPMNSIGFFGYHIMTAGSYEGELFEQTDGDTVKKLYTENGCLNGFMMLGNVARAGIYTSLIRNKTPLSEVDFDLVSKEPSLIAFTEKYRRQKLGGVL